MKNKPYVIVPSNTKQGYDIAYPGDTINFEFPNSKTRRGRVGRGGVAQTITTACNQGVVIAMRNRPEEQVLRNIRTEYGKQIRKEYGSGTIKEKRKNMTCFEPRTDGLTNTITTVQKDNLVLVQTGQLYGTDTEPNPQAGRVYDPDGLSPTLDTCQGGNRMPKIELKEESMNTAAEGLAIRRLTPKECWRLMGFSDDDFAKAKSVCSDTQLYKQAGNSIVVNVLEGILGNLFKQERSDWLDKILDE